MGHPRHQCSQSFHLLGLLKLRLDFMKGLFSMSLPGLRLLNQQSHIGQLGDQFLSGFPLVVHWIQLFFVSFFLTYF